MGRQRRINRDKIYLWRSDNPEWEFEAYDYRGLFIGYLGYLGKQ
jgi:hypothetical protein